MTKISKWGVLALGVSSAAVATICDAVHVKTKTLSYPKPMYWKQAGWVFPGFTTAFLSMAVVYAGLAQKMPDTFEVNQSQQKGNYTDFVEAMGTFAIVYMMSGVGNYHPRLLAFIFYGTFILRLGQAYEKEWLAVIALLLAFGGMFTEGMMSKLGLVEYREPEVFNVPWWLGGLYMHGAFALREGMRTLAYK